MSTEFEKKNITAEGDPSEGKKPSKPPRTGRRWTVMDTAILLLVLVAVAGTVFRGVMNVREENEETPVGPFDIYFSVEQVHTSVLADIQGFDPLYDYATGEQLGYVGVYSDGTVALAPVGVVTLRDGETVAAEGCMVCLEGVMKDGSLLISGTERYLAPGSEITLRTSRAVMTVVVTKISLRADS